MKLVIAIGVLIVATMAMGDRYEMGLWDVEQVWKNQIGKEITEENLIASLRLDWEAQKLKIKSDYDKVLNSYKDGIITKKELLEYAQSITVPAIERDVALRIISGNKYKSPAIDQAVLEIYTQNIDNPTTRLHCIEVMLNNDQKNGLLMLHEYISNKEKITLNFRLLGASLMIKHGEPVSQDIIKEGLLSPEKNTRAMAERIQKELTTLDKKKPLVPVKTIAPPKSIE